MENRVYVINDRLRYPTGGNTGTLNGLSKTVPLYSGVDTVYSFRTGKGARGHTHTSYSPPGSTLVQKLSSRKEYLEGVDRSLSYDGAPIVYTQGRTNAFTRTRTRFYGRCDYFSIEDSKYKFRYFGAPTGSIMVPAGLSTGMPQGYQANVINGTPLGPTYTTIQSFGSRMHSALSPYKAQAGIGETLMELMSGNIPKLSSKLFLSLKDGSFLGTLKRAPKNASQDYLNSQFGIGPILSDLYSILIEGIMLHDSIYGRSFRRTGRSSKTSTVSYFKGPFFNIGGYVRLPSNKIGFAGLGQDYYGNPGPEHTMVMNHDMRFRARFTLARASDSENARYDMALDLVRSYGLWTPSLLWDIAPWSWVFDWFLNIGRGISNAYDYGKDGGLKSDYACVTARTLVNVSHGPYSYSRSSGGSVRTYRATYSQGFTDTLNRVPVNPFGSYVQLPNLGSWQKSILLALGIARSK